METKLHPCCNLEENLESKPSGKSDLDLKVCKVCKARHFELNVDLGIYNTKGI